MASETGVCDLCCHETSAWALGPCDHPTCLACCVRLRVLCNQRECPVCREELDQVVVVDKKKPFLSITIFRLTSDRKYGIMFEKQELKQLYKSLRDNKCSLCTEVFRTWHPLREHVRKAHDRLYCEICLENLTLFPHEFKTYTRQELTRHRRDGDPDDKSHKGHPLCKFCDERYLDNDALHSHLRVNHFWCHFCESDGKQEYYSKYPALRKHFKTDHFLCEVGDCKEEKFTSVFRTKIDFQAHRAQVHTKGMSKAEAKQLRQIEVDFTVAGRSEDAEYHQVRLRGRQGGSRTNGTQFSRLREEPEALPPPPSYPQGGERTVSNSPKIERKRRNSPPELKTQTSSLAQSSNVRETGIVGADAAQQSVPPFYYRELNQEFRKPPGFENIEPKKLTNIVSASEWPDLTTGRPSTRPQPSQPPPRYANATSGVSLSTDFPQLGFAHQTLPQQQGAQTQPSGHNYSKRTNKTPLELISSGNTGFPSLPNRPNPHPSSSLPPPGFNSTNRKPPEADVIDQVRAALQHDKSKLTQFMTLSGWFKDSDITVHEYSSQCYHLMGEIWNDIGPELATVLPSKSKQRELGDFFRSRKQTQASKKSKAGNRPHSNVWRSGRAMNSGSMLNEEEYPSLGSSATASKREMAGMGDPWNLRVQV